MEMIWCSWQNEYLIHKLLVNDANIQIYTNTDNTEWVTPAPAKPEPTALSTREVGESER
jgi:hypothetical protein